MNVRIFPLFLTLTWSVLWADFSETTIQPHPFYPYDQPFVLEISGTWPSDCHPGEQNPIIRSYTGDSVLIEMDMSVVHITCNQVPSPYRILVDMSDVIGSVEGGFSTLDVELRFGEDRLQQTVMLDCKPVVPCPIPPVEVVLPRPGLLDSEVLESQGLLLARQNQWLAAYPLTYDDDGDSEWLFGGGEIVEDVFFAPLYRLEGGQCLACPVPDLPPRTEEVGKLTLFIDSESLVQVKVDDGPFLAYRNTVFGYTTVRLGPDGSTRLAELTGRWGITLNRGTEPPLGDLTEFFPAAFDIQVDFQGFAGEETPLNGEKHYTVKTITGQVVGDLACRGDTDVTGRIPVCDYTEPGDADEPLFRFYQVGPSDLRIEYARAVIAIGTAPGGKAVRLD